jgi:outer membrane protein insertion porin family
VFGAVPYSVGDNVGAEEIRTIARSLFQTETFDDVQIGRDGNVLVIVVKERPTIDSIEFEGNKAIKTEALIEGLQGSGLSEGQIFKKVTLDQIASDLERQYVSQGRYDANIETNIENLPRNRVAIKVDVYEGNVSGIRHINIVGNTVFDDETLIELLELKLPGWLSFYTKDDQYSREKLQSDIEVLESHYLDRGYLNFRVDSTQVSIAPNMEDVYITVNVIEGDQFKISAVEVAGELRDIPEENIRAMLLTREGQTFSRQYMTFSEERIESALGNAGYTFASATGEPAANDDGETVTVKYFIDAGKRAYVRRLNFQGNTVTQDHVLRREMRQMEGGWASTAMIEGSKIRLQRLGFFKDVSVETPTVPGTDDQIDVNYTVEEQPSGSISATVGYAQRMGLILGLGYQESNVFGTGNSINIGINRSDYQQALNVSFFDPYYTVDGVSRGYAAFSGRVIMKNGTLPASLQIPMV